MQDRMYFCCTPSLLPPPPPSSPPRPPPAPMEESEGYKEKKAPLRQLVDELVSRRMLPTPGAGRGRNVGSVQRRVSGEQRTDPGSVPGPAPALEIWGDGRSGQEVDKGVVEGRELLEGKGERGVQRREVEIQRVLL